MADDEQGFTVRGRPVGSTMIEDAKLVTFHLAHAEKIELQRLAQKNQISFSQLLRMICREEIDGKHLDLWRS